MFCLAKYEEEKYKMNKTGEAVPFFLLNVQTVRMMLRFLLLFFFLKNKQWQFLQILNRNYLPQKLKICTFKITFFKQHAYNTVWIFLPGTSSV